MSDSGKSFDSLSRAEQLAHRHSDNWAGPYRQAAAKAEASLLLYRLNRAVDVMTSGEKDSSLPPFSGLGAALLTSPPGSNALSHGGGTGADILGNESIGTQQMRSLNVNLRFPTGLADNAALQDWHQSRKSLLSRPAPWTVVTAPQSELMCQTHHPLAPKGSDERLLPHSTAWSQTLFLAVRHRMNAITSWVGKNHPEWLDMNGDIAPYSMLHDDAELSPFEMIKRDQRLAELSFLRDLAEQGMLYIDHLEKGREFFRFKNIGEQNTPIPKSADDWAHATEGQAMRWQRVFGRSGDLTQSNGKYDPQNATSKAQALCFMASHAGVPMEEATYQDRSSGDRQAREVVFLNTRWMSQERLALIEQLISHYQATGISQDFSDYLNLLKSQGASVSMAKERAKNEFELPVLDGIERTMGILDSLAEHHLKRPSIDIGEAYISLLDANKDDPRTPIVSPLGIQRFGLSCDPSKLNESVLTEVGSTINLDKPWVLRRGFQPRTFQVIDQVISETGSIGVTLPGDPAFPVGANLKGKASEADYLIRTLTEQVKLAQKSGSFDEKHLLKILDDANRRIESLGTAFSDMRETAKTYKRRSMDLEHALATSEDLYVAANIHALELMAEADKKQLPPIREPSRAAQWMSEHGYEVPEHQRFIQGRDTKSDEMPITLAEAFRLTDNMEMAEGQSVFERFGSLPDEDEEESDSVGPTII